MKQSFLQPAEIFTSWVLKITNDARLSMFFTMFVFGGFVTSMEIENEVTLLREEASAGNHENLEETSKDN